MKRIHRIKVVLIMALTLSKKAMAVKPSST